MQVLLLHMSQFLSFTICFFLLAQTGIVFGGQSLVLNPGVKSLSVEDPNRPSGQSWRVEFQLHDWSGPSQNTNGGYIWQLAGLGVDVAIVPNGDLWITNRRDAIPSGEPCALPLSGRTNVMVRVQRDAANKEFHCEIWNYDGSGYFIRSQQIVTFLSWPYSGGQIGSDFTTAHLAFLRVYSSLVNIDSKPPTTASGGERQVEWKFDGALADDSGNGRVLNMPSASYSGTPNQAPPSAVIQTLNSPTWSKWLPLRAGYPAQLDGSKSFSMADNSDAVSYFWQQLSGPSTVNWSDRTTAQPTITGLVFGGYKFRLKVRDATGNETTTDLEVGSVATDDNGVVIFPDPRLDKLFGPTIAFGRNPWPFHDETSIRVADYHWAQQGPNGGPLTREWETPLAGTVSFAAGSPILTGTGTNFQVDFCGGGTTPLYDIAVRWDVTNASNDYPRTPKSAPGGLSRASQYILTCDSATQITLRSPWVYSTDSQSGKQYSRVCCGWWISQVDGHTYYDGALAFYAMYYRSGNTKYRDAARFITDGWLGYPTIGWGASIQQNPRTTNMTSLFVRYLVDNDGDSTNYQWVRKMVNNAGDNPPGPSVLIADPREDGYQFSWRALQAIFEPDPTERAEALTYLRDAYVNRWQPQQRANGNYWSNYFENNFGGGSFTATNGSAIVTGSGIPAAKCYPGSISSDTATASATNGSTSVTGGSGWTGLAGKVAEIYGQRDGSYYIFFSPVASSTSTTITLVHPYDGTTNLGGNVRVRVMDSDGYNAVWFATTSYVQDQAFYTCTWNSSTQITLDRPYEGTSGAKYAARANLAARGSQPFMMGIIASALKWASEGLAADYPTDSANYLTLADNVGKWIKNHGYNPVTKGLYYGVDFPNCVPMQAWNCDLSLKEDRDLSAEASAAMTVVYQKSPTQENKDFGDQFYGAQWGKLGGPYSDGQWNQYDDGSLYKRGKYLGFAFGMGLSHQWPAARLGGVAPEDLRTYSYGFTLPSGADKIQLTVLRPNGETVSPTACTTSPCTFTYDARQGKHLVRHTYQTTAGASRGVSDWREIQ